MKQGTYSVLLGCHSPIHSLIVLVAWVKVYGELPSLWQIVGIFLHDIGHFGTDYLNDYEAKKNHWRMGARIAKRLFGQKGYEFIAGHCAYNGQPRSELYYPDKYSWVIAPSWWMISNTYFEPKLQRRGSSRKESAIMFKEAMKENMGSNFIKQGHDIYLEQW